MVQAKGTTAAGGRYRWFPEVKNQGAMRSATSEQGDYDFEVEGLLGVRGYFPFGFSTIEQREV